MVHKQQQGCLHCYEAHDLTYKPQKVDPKWTKTNPQKLSKFYILGPELFNFRLIHLKVWNVRCLDGVPSFHQTFKLETFSTSRLIMNFFWKKKGTWSSGVGPLLNIKKVTRVLLFRRFMDMLRILLPFFTLSFEELVHRLSSQVHTWPHNGHVYSFVMTKESTHKKNLLLSNIKPSFSSYNVLSRVSN